MNFFAWTINYALIPAPTAASLHDASSILTFALLPLLLPPPPPFLLAIVSARDTDQGTSRTRVHRDSQSCVRARTSSSFPFPSIYIYIVPIRFRIVFSKYFLTLISHDFHPWGCLKFIPLEREKKDRVNKFKAKLINPPPGIIP